MTDEALIHLITSYTHEAGVRSLERELGAVCRAKAVEYAEARDRAIEAVAEGAGRKVGVEEVKKAGYRTEVNKEDVERFLGVPKFDREELERENVVGVSTGLAYQASISLPRSELASTQTDPLTRLEQGSGNGGVLRSSFFVSPPSFPAS